MFRIFLFVSIGVLFCLCCGCTNSTTAGIPAVTPFDAASYSGVWYEIARYDHSFERGMDNTMALYILQDDGQVLVLNSGWKDGKTKVAEGKARQPDPLKDPSWLEVSFFLNFYSDYNILLLDQDYQYVLVGSRSPEYLWILSRQPSISDEVRDAMLAEAVRLGYDTSKLIWVDQSANLDKE